MKTIINVICCIFLLQAMSYARVYTSETRVIIFDFEAINIPEGDARAISEIIRAEVVKYKVFTVIDKKQVESILKEQEFQSTGITTDKSRIKLGQLLNAEKIVYGSVSRLNKIHYLIIKIVDLGKGNIEWTDCLKIPDINKIDVVITSYIKKIMESEKKSSQRYAGEKREVSSKSSWYIGVGMGIADGRVKYENGDSYEFNKFFGDNTPKSWDSDYSYLTYNLGIGIIPNPYFHFGFELSFLPAYPDEDDEKNNSSFGIHNILAVATIFPVGEGFNIKLGYGCSILNLKTDVDNSTSETKYYGNSVLAGIGYAINVSSNNYICLNFDYSVQFYSDYIDRIDSWNFSVSYYCF